MATTVDERIVAAKFDASDFEKGVNKTVKKLDELKKSLNLTDATKSVKELAEKTEVSTNSMSKSLDKLTERFTTFTGMIKQKILSGLADEVAGIFFKMENSVKSFIRSISSDQVRYGMSKYEQMLSSVRVMMSAGESQSTAYDKIGQLQEYSDQTSYSLSQMTDALSKLRAAGVNIDEATKSVEGIANACANAGINATDAQRAFYNLSQAYAKGSLNYTDYKSLELLNMTTEKFKENMLEAAVEAGTLKKVSDGVYQTINTTDKKVKAGKKVTVKNLQDMLKYDFINNNAMNKLFGEKFYFDEKMFKKYKDKWTNQKTGEVDREKAIEEAKKDFGEIAVDAYLAAREARSLTDVFNTLKDVVSTGWATSFEYMFGKLEQAKTFFTQLAEVGLADIVYKIGEYRNALLGYWGALDAKGNSSGGVVLQQTILNINDALATLLKTFLQVLPGFDELYGKEEDGTPILEDLGTKLFELSMRIRDFSERIKQAAKDFNDFMHEKVFEDKTVTRIEMLRKVFSTFGSVLTIVGRLVAIAFTGISKAFYTLAPIFDGFLVIIEKITEPLKTLGNEAGQKGGAGVFKSIEEGIINISEVLRPVAEVLGQIIGFLGEIGKFFAEMAIGTITANITFFTDIIDILSELITGKSAKKLAEGESVLEGIKRDFEGIVKACSEGLGAIKNFFSALIGDIRTLLGLTNGDEKSQEGTGGVFSGLINFFNTNEFVQKAKAWVNQAIVDVGDFIKSIPQRVRTFGANIYSTLRGLFFEDQTRYNGTQLETKTVLTPLGQWLDGVIQDIKKFIISIPDKIVEGIGTIGNWIDTVFNAIFGQDQANAAAKETSGKENEKAKADDQLLSEFDKFVQGIITSCKEWFEDLPNKIQNGMKSVGDFFGRVLNALDEFFFGKKVTKTVIAKQTGTNKNHIVKYTQVTERYKTGFSKWLDDVIRDVKKFIADIPKYIKAGIKGAGDIINTIISALFGTDKDKETNNKDIEEKLEKPFKGISLTGILNTIKDIGATLLNQIARMFTGTEDIEKNQQWFSQLIADGITWISTNADIALKEVLKFLSSIPSTIANIFTGGEQKSEEASDNPIGSALIEFGKKIGKFISVDLPATVLTFIQDATIEFGKLWDKLYNAITGKADENAEEAAKEATENVNSAVDGAEPEVSAWQAFVTKLGDAIKHIWDDLPTWIAEGIEMAIVGINEAISGLGEWLKGIGVPDEAEGVTASIVKGTMNAVGESSKDAADDEEPKLVTAIKSIGERIKTLLVEIIPKFIQDAWIAISKLGANIWNGISSIFSGEVPQKEKDDSVKTVGETIREFFVEKLPGYIQEGWAWISTKAAEVFEGFSAIFTGQTPNSEIGKSIADFGNMIYNFIIKDIPAAIKRAFEYIKRLLNGGNNSSVVNYEDTFDFKKNFRKESLVGFANINGEIKTATDNFSKEYKDQMNDTKNDMKEVGADKPGFWDFLSGIGDSLLNAFASIGPTILNGLASALDWISNIAQIVINVISGKSSVGEEIEKAYGKEMPELKESLKNIGESLKRFFIETIPNFIGSAIGALLKEAPKWFESLFGGISDAAAEAEEKEQSTLENTGDEKKVEEPLTAIQGIVSFIKGFLEEIGAMFADDLKTIGIIVAVVMLLKSIKELFSLAREAEAAGDVIKWTAIAIGLAGIANFLAGLNGIINSGDDSKIAAAERIIDKLAGLMEKIAWIVGMFSVGKLFDALGAKWDQASTDKGNILVNSLGNAFNNFFEVIGLSAGANVAAGFASATIDLTTSAIAKSIMTLSDGISETLEIIAPFIENLGGLNDKIDLAIDSINKITKLYSLFLGSFSALYTEATGLEATEDDNANAVARFQVRDEKNKELIAVGPVKDFVLMGAFLQELEQRLNLFLHLSQFINQIAGALNKIKDVENLQEKMTQLSGAMTGVDFTNFMTKLLNALKSAVDASNLSAKEFGTTKYMIPEHSGMTLAIEMLSDSLNVFIAAMSDLTMEKVNAFEKTLDVFNKLGEALSGKETVLGKNYLDKVLGKDGELRTIGSQIKSFGLSMKGFYDYITQIPGFDDSNVKITERIVNSIIDVTYQMSKVVQQLQLYGTNFELLETLGNKMPGFAVNMGKFITEFNEMIPQDLSKDRSAVLLDSVTAVKELLTTVNALQDLLRNFNTSDMSTLVDRLFSSMQDDNTRYKLAGAMKLIDDVMLKVVQSEDFGTAYSTMGSTIAEKIFAGMQNAFNTDPDLQLKITPILELGPMKEQWKETFGDNTNSQVDWAEVARSAYGANDQTDAERVKATDLYPKIDAVTKAVKRMTRKSVTLSNLITAFKNLQIRTDTDVLAGEMVDAIDERIGVKIMQIKDYLTPGG